VKQCVACLQDDNFIQVNAEVTWRRKSVIIQQGCRNSSVQQLHLHFTVLFYLRPLHMWTCTW